MESQTCAPPDVQSLSLSPNSFSELAGKRMGLVERYIMNKNNLLVRYDKDLRLRMMYPEARKEITKDVVRFIRKSPGMNFVGFTFANELRLDRVLIESWEYFAPMNQPFTWKVYEHDRLPSMEEKLSLRGFVSDGGDAVMVLDVKNAPVTLFQPAKTVFAASIRWKVSRMSFTFWTRSGAGTIPGSMTGSGIIFRYPVI